MENNIYLVGVGGQGVVRLGQIIAAYAIDEGQKVKLFKKIGMAQRGGPTLCEIRIGEVSGSRIPPLSADLVVAMELAESVKAVEYVKPGGTVILNKSKVYPIHIMTHPEKYPGEGVIEELFKKTGAKLVWIDAKKIASEISLPIAENIVMLGAITLLSGFDKELMIEVLKQNVPRQIEKNISAFLAGYKIAEGK
jgi:indolepyruvate ferredoxin oxidoreductase beta subunit